MGIKEKEKVHRCGIMGGTFDPIHLGHLVAAETARVEFGLERVIFIPSGRPPHKQGRTYSFGEHRYAMVKLAIADNPYFDVSRWEIDRENYSYTIDTLHWLSKKQEERGALYFITGADTVLDILTWRRVEEVAELCYFIAATRPGFDLAELNRVTNRLPVLKGKIFNMGIPAMDISSTNIRWRVQSGHSIKYLVPEKVENYIKQHRLYI